MPLRIIELLTLILMMIIVAWYWHKHDNNVLMSFLFTFFTCAVYYFNAPNFVIARDNTESVNAFFIWPFSLYEKFGTSYIVVTNILLTVIGASIGRSKNMHRIISREKAKAKFDSFSSDAMDLKIIGRDLDFLLKQDNDRYEAQRNKICGLGTSAKLLCEWTNKQELIALYYELSKDGNVVMAYTSKSGVANLKGQIKVDSHNERRGLFVSRVQSRIFHKKEAFEVTNMGSGFFLDAVDNQFDEILDNSLHPYIRCIALDLGGVYFNGDVDDFYSFLDKKFCIKMERSRKDRLNIDDDLMLGKITIQEFIQKKVSRGYTSKLSKDDWNEVLKQWQDTWHPNEQIKKLISDLNGYGYIIVPFSNLDKQNGEKYIREHYLPECCTNRFFSYEKGASKPSQNAFSKFEKMVKDRQYVFEAYQILLIDDEADNIEEAISRNWTGILFYNRPGGESVNDLIEKLKENRILPKNYSLHGTE